MTSVLIPVDAVPSAFTLEALLEGPESGSPVVLCHPHPAFGGSMRIPIMAAIADALIAAGHRVLRFNFRGIGASGGTASGGHTEHLDVRAACAFMRSISGTGPNHDLDLVGYSFGALMVAAAIASGETCRRCVALGFPTVIVGDHADRIAAVTAANAAVPTCYISGDDDRFCDIERLRGWAASTPRTRIEVIAGAGHFPAGAHLDDMLARAVAFLA